MPCQPGCACRCGTPACACDLTPRLRCSMCHGHLRLLNVITLAGRIVIATFCPIDDLAPKGPTA